MSENTTEQPDQPQAKAEIMGLSAYAKAARFLAKPWLYLPMSALAIILALSDLAEGWLGMLVYVSFLIVFVAIVENAIRWKYLDGYLAGSLDAVEEVNTQIKQAHKKENLLRKHIAQIAETHRN